MLYFLRAEYAEYCEYFYGLGVTPMSFRDWVNITYWYEFLDNQD
jgi:hypothetical protein